MMPSMQVALVINVFLLCFLFSKRVKKTDRRVTALIVFNSFVASIYSNHLIYGDFSFFDALFYTFSEPLEVVVDAIYFALFIAVATVFAESITKETKLVRLHSILPAALSFSLLLCFSVILTPSIYEFSKSSLRKDDIALIKERCPEGVRMEPNQFNVMLTCYIGEKESIDITYDYSGTGRDEYHNSFYEVNEDLLDLTHDVYFKDYDTGHVVARMFYQDMSASSRNYRMTFHYMLEDLIGRLNNSIIWEQGK